MYLNQKCVSTASDFKQSTEKSIKQKQKPIDKKVSDFSAAFGKTKNLSFQDQFKPKNGVKSFVIENKNQQSTPEGSEAVCFQASNMQTKSDESTCKKHIEQIIKVELSRKKPNIMIYDTLEKKLGSFLDPNEEDEKSLTILEKK